MSKGSILLIIPCSDFLFVVDPVFNHFESKQEKKKTKGSETPVSSGDCLDPSDLHADLFFSTWVRESESSGILAFPCFCLGILPHKSTEINSIDLVGMIFSHGFWPYKTDAPSLNWCFFNLLDWQNISLLNERAWAHHFEEQTTWFPCKSPLEV